MYFFFIFLKTYFIISEQVADSDNNETQQGYMDLEKTKENDSNIQGEVFEDIEITTLEEIQINDPILYESIQASIEFDNQQILGINNYEDAASEQGTSPRSPLISLDPERLFMNSKDDSIENDLDAINEYEDSLNSKLDGE